MEKAIRCRNKDAHEYYNGIGNILIVFDKNKLYVKCSERSCNRWTELTINFPGINIDFSKALIEQRLVSKGHRFKINNIDKDIERAVVIMKDD